MKQIEASKPVSIQVTLSNLLRKLPMQGLFGDVFFRGGGSGLFCLGGFGVLYFKVFILYCLGVFFVLFVFVGAFWGFGIFLIGN